MTQYELADEAHLPVVVIQLQEKGIPHHLHPTFLRRFPEVAELIPEYQAARTKWRQRNFAPVAEAPVDSPGFLLWLDQRRLTPKEFSELGCMPEVDINYALRHWRLPVVITKFFEEINA